jgi:tagatose-1,6-bisphosphate aldolase
MTGFATKTGLATIATDQATFAIVAMDQRNTLKRMYHAAGVPDPTDEELVQIKADTVQALRGSASGYLLDPTFGTPALSLLPTEGPAYGVLVAAEPAERGTINGEPRGHRDPTLNAQWVREQGGDALKFYVQLRADRTPGPDGVDTTAEVLQVVREVVADCRQAGIPSVIENLIFPLAGEEPSTPAQKADRIVEAAILLDELKPDLIKLEYPGDAAACRRLANSVKGPWAVLSAGVAFDEFAAVLRVSCDEGGTSGFIAGRSIWKDAVGMTEPARRSFLADEGKRRLDNLVQVIDGRARPYTEVSAR